MITRVDKLFLKCYTILVKSLMRADFLHEPLKHIREALKCWKSACGKNVRYRLGECYNQKHRIPALKVLSGVFFTQFGWNRGVYASSLVLGMKLIFYIKESFL